MACKLRKHVCSTKSRMKKHRYKTTVGQPIHTTLHLSGNKLDFLRKKGRRFFVNMTTVCSHWGVGLVPVQMQV